MNGHFRQNKERWNKYVKIAGLFVSVDDRWETQGWYTETGSYVDWSQNDHGAVLVGYTERTVTIANSIAGLVEYSKEQFEHVYESRGENGLVIQ